MLRQAPVGLMATPAQREIGRRVHVDLEVVVVAHGSSKKGPARCQAGLNPLRRTCEHGMHRLGAWPRSLREVAPWRPARAQVIKKPAPWEGGGAGKAPGRRFGVDRSCGCHGLWLQLPEPDGRACHAVGLLLAELLRPLGHRRPRDSKGAGKVYLPRTEKLDCVCLVHAANVSRMSR